jgi:hypothetical protein
MRRGAVVMMDALGFRGIWDRVAQPSDVFDKMESLRKRAESTMARHNVPEIGITDARATFLSDTIVLVISARGDDADLDASTAIVLAALRASDLMTEALERAPHLAYRGSIAFGDYEMKGPFVLGPAVDEAAAHSELAEGAFVWLAPSACAAWRKLPDGRAQLLPTDVPLKEGRRYSTFAVSPFDPTDHRAERRDIADSLLATFDTGRSSLDIDVQIKRQNTETFLRRAIEYDLPRA